jgi:hypothetical protein
MVAEVVRTSFASYPTPALSPTTVSPTTGRAGSSPQRFAPANDALVLENDLIADGSRATRFPRGTQIRGQTVSLDELMPRAAFAAQLMGQENPGTRAHLEDFAGMTEAYTTAEQRPSRAAVGSTLTTEM